MEEVEATAEVEVEALGALISNRISLLVYTRVRGLRARDHEEGRRIVLGSTSQQEGGEVSSIMTGVREGEARVYSG